MKKNQLTYQTGFGNYFETEAEPGTLPVGRNNPQRPAKGLYAEQLSGTAFTALPHENLRAWFYRILPSAKHSSYRTIDVLNWQSNAEAFCEIDPSQMRWKPFAPESLNLHKNLDFVSGMFTFCIGGDPKTQTGSSAHMYVAGQSMKDRALCNADGDMLILPQIGELRVKTESGLLDVAPGEVVVVPRGIKFAIEFDAPYVRGYVCENFGAHFQLPYRGPIGANGLANARDFQYPTAHFENKPGSFELITKFCGKFFSYELDHSPFDVVAWHGNYAPYKYDLARFNTINTVSFDHPDPSIFTVLTSPSLQPGVANVDFVIFPPRWMVAEDTFRPPWYHRNVMSEFMGLIHGIYDAKSGDEFSPGGSSLHNCMSAHGPDAAAFYGASRAELRPHKIDQTLAFMFESRLVYLPTKQSVRLSEFQTNYLDCWKDLQSQYK